MLGMTDEELHKPLDFWGYVVVAFGMLIVCSPALMFIAGQLGWL